MLDLQRASAGSGKTYALAKYFLRYLIGIREPGTGIWRLRTSDELRDGLGRILAVTFTNKATNEMQMRIVDKLDALAQYKPGMKRPDYLDDFVKEYDGKVAEAEICAKCGEALHILLNQYSDFNVSTIDAFFQTILRTFAYESGYSDNYQVEMESGYVSRVGLNATLDDVDNGSTDPDMLLAKEWISKILANETSSGWNLFQKKESKFSPSPYQKLLADFGRIDSEEFRERQKTLDDYFESDCDLMGLYNELEDKYSGALMRAYEAFMTDVDNVLKITDVPEMSNARADTGKLRMGARNCKAFKWNEVPSKPFVTLGEDYRNKKKVAQAWSVDPALWDCAWAAYCDMVRNYGTWMSLLTDPKVRLWMLLRDSFPFIGLLQAVSRKRQDYLNENNSVELGETSHILRTIIGDSCTPFVYERMGTFLDHFLIDEFQDTSRIQWEIIKPLIDESISRDQDDLIIGDAKQSIYRFRNAEPELITAIVPEEMAPSVNIKGNTPAENTNWRSDRLIVDWNNRFFRYLVNELPEFVTPSRSEAVRNKFANLYGNVEQNAHKMDGGYVKVYLAANQTRNPELDPFKVENEALRIILDALERGYRQRDICVLTRKVDKGMAMVQCLRNYNARRGEGDPKLEFVSEQSLLIGNSLAVMNVETILQTIARGNIPDVREAGPERARYGVGNIKDLKSGIMFYHQSHPGQTIAQSMEEFPDNQVGSRPVEDMLGDMQTTALPALVEAIIARFIPTDLRRSDAVFLAAFQDSVLEYCEGHSSDLVSFLNWWDRQKTGKSIASPEDIDAIRIMTIHKAKGLEFPVTIITQPESERVRLGDYVGGKEWKWISRDELELNDEIAGRFPPIVPVNITEKLRGTVLESRLFENYDLETMDSLNLLYVAMTRAVNELYIFADRRSGNYASNPNRSVGALLESFADDAMDRGDDDMRKSDEETHIVLEFGERPACKPVGKKQDGGADGSSSLILADYHSRKRQGAMKCRDADSAVRTEEDRGDAAPGTDDMEDERDPRSRGNVCHAIMERVRVLDDLPRQIERAKALGLVGENEEFLEELQAHVDNMRGVPEVETWFGSDIYKVITERAVILRERGIKRPDRIVVHRDGERIEAVVVDYKFGAEEPAHGKQVHGYVERLKATGRYAAVHGYLWYVFLDKVVLVE